MEVDVSFVCWGAIDSLVEERVPICPFVVTDPVVFAVSGVVTSEPVAPETVDVAPVVVLIDVVGSVSVSVLSLSIIKKVNDQRHGNVFHCLNTYIIYA